MRRLGAGDQVHPLRLRVYLLLLAVRFFSEKTRLLSESRGRDRSIRAERTLAAIAFEDFEQGGLGFRPLLIEEPRSRQHRRWRRPSVVEAFLVSNIRARYEPTVDLDRPRKSWPEHRVISE